VADERPAEVALVQDFINTYDLEDDSDEVETSDALASWLAARGLLEPGAAVDEGEHRLALELRESLRRLLRGQHEHRVDPASVAEINDLAAALPLRVRFDDGGHATVEPGLVGVRGALGGILGDVALAMSSGSWARLKTCSADSCQWVFYDRSKNRSGRWCSMRVCGNRSKTRSYRARRSSEPV
jgi:predicted RNA-binding Zn ribbon-like protein